MPKDCIIGLCVGMVLGGIFTLITCIILALTS
jgi:hypothetical protein